MDSDEIGSTQIDEVNFAGRNVFSFIMRKMIIIYARWGLVIGHAK